LCGINGIIATRVGLNENARDILVEMNELIKHRGPDDDGFIILMLIYTIGMAMRRLSIIDLSSGKQPIKMMTGYCCFFLMVKSTTISSSK
jgi:asparagine synthase (glutamine-hydrolysing)